CAPCTLASFPTRRSSDLGPFHRSRPCSGGRRGWISAPRTRKMRAFFSLKRAGNLMNAVVVAVGLMLLLSLCRVHVVVALIIGARSEEHTSELQSREKLVC